MYHYSVRQISASEYHVIETRLVNEPEFILAKCSGPVPAWDIVYAMRISQCIRLDRDQINGAVSGIKNALERFDNVIKAAEAKESRQTIHPHK